MGTLASKVGENIVGKRLGMSEKDRKLLGTVFGMAGGAYGGYAGSAGFGSSGIGASGSAGGMGGQSPKVGGDYGTAMNLYSQPQPQTFTGFNQPMSSAYNSPQTFTGVDAPFSSMASGNGYAGTPYQPIEASNNPYISQYVGNADAPADLFQTNAPINGYNQMASMPVETYGMDQYRLTDMSQVGSSTRAQELYNRNLYNDLNLRQQGNSYFDMANTPIADYNYSGMDSSAFLDSRPTPRPTPVYQGPAGLDTSAQTFALDSPSRTIDLAPSGTPLEVIDVSGSNLGMESVYNSGGNPDIELVPSTGDGYLISPDDQVRVIQTNPDGTFTELPANTDLSTSQGVEEFINMDQIRADEMPGGPLDPFGTGPNITAANYSVSGQPQSIGSYIENGPIVDNSLNADPRNIYANKMQSAFLEPPRDSIGRPILSDGIKAQARYDAPVELFDPQGTQAGLKAEKDAIKFQAEYGNTPEQIQATAQEKVDDARKKLAEGGKRGDNRVIEREQQNIASTIDEVRATMQKQMTEDPSKWQKFLDKIPKSVKEWATMTGVSLLDMWIKQSLFGQDYDDQIAEGGGGGGVLRGSSPVVSPYSGGGSGGGGKGVLFSMGGSGQQGRGTHIMALQ